MKNLFISILILSLYGCASDLIENKPKINDAVHLCTGTINLPEKLANQFEAIEDAKLLNEALGNPDEGKLCQGQVYKSKQNAHITIFRAWNSTNSGSKLGKWWAFEQPAGKIAKYRSENEICYQWSALDALISCTLKPETKIVVGTGQSAVCSKYLTYPVSAKQQIYIYDASISLNNCTVFNGEFNWR